MSRSKIPYVGPKARLLLHDWADHSDWLRYRQSGIGGSDIGALVGVSPYSTPFDVWRAKTGEAKDISDQPAVEWGHRLEEAVATKTADEIGLVARTGGGLWQHVDHPIAMVTPDRIVTRNRSWQAVGVIEAKTVGGGSDGEWRDGGAPLHYQAQVQWQLGILGLDVGWLGCLVLSASREFHVREIRFDREWFGEMVEAAETFWNRHVLAGEPPMHDYTHPRTGRLLDELHPHAVLPSVELPLEAERWLEEYRQAKTEADAAGARLDEVKNRIKDALGGAAAGYIGDWEAVSYPEISSSRVDVRKLREEYPDVAEECSVTTTSRRLTVRAPAAD